MATRPLMAITACLLGVAGLSLLFVPHELASAMGMAPVGFVPVVCQVLGGALLGLACLDWLSRGARLGGIYGRPLVLANLMHFVTAGLSLVRHGLAERTPAIWALAMVYMVLALAFGRVLLTSPRDLPPTAVPTSR